MRFTQKHQNLIVFLIIGAALAYSVGLTLWIRSLYSIFSTIVLCTVLGLIGGAMFGNHLDKIEQEKYFNQKQRSLSNDTQSNRGRR